MIDRLDSMTPGSLTRLNREAIRDRARIRALLERAAQERVALSNGINRRNQPRRAFINRIERDRIFLVTDGLEDVGGATQRYFSFSVNGDQYFFAVAVPANVPGGGSLTVDMPGTVFRAERRDLYRRREVAPDAPSRWVRIQVANGAAVEGSVLDSSPYGLGVKVLGADVMHADSHLRVYLDGEDDLGVTAKLCHSSSLGDGWVRLGLALTTPPEFSPLPIERRDRILGRTPKEWLRDRVEMVYGAVSARSTKMISRTSRKSPVPQVPVVEYLNDAREPIRAIVDRYGDTRGRTTVIIPPAWGRTKETLLPLAAIIGETFARAGEAVAIVRFDGTHRRGESYLHPDYRSPGREYLNFTFSQAVRDIESTIDYVTAAPDLQPSKIVLVTFSLAAVEGRRAVAQDAGSRLDGWVSVVGMVDLQSALRTISGGVDFAYGLLRGVRFGHHELVGVVADMDHTGLDAIERRMVFLEEARRDMAQIKIPVSWLHGRFDAWMDVERVRDALSSGDTNARRLIEVPTGHQLRNSSEALETFQLVAEEVSEMALGRRLRGRLPSLAPLRRRRDAELARIPRSRVDLQAFWGDYLLGRDRRAGMELLTATAAYKNFMEVQIDQLSIEPGERIADLGSGVGDFPLNLARRPDLPPGVSVVEIDYVFAALLRARERLARVRLGRRLTVAAAVATLDPIDGTNVRVPLASESCDKIFASFVISYLADPYGSLAEMYRLLRPSGILVLSTLKRDADLSKIFVEGMGELSADPAASIPGANSVGAFEDIARSFFNDATKILDLEEAGQFRFWDQREIVGLLRSVGFRRVESRLCFGDPPQAVVVRAIRP